MPAPHGISQINLLPKDSFEFSSLGKILKWSTTVGRVLVVMTEFVVLLAFASRFYFDKKINDQTEEINSKLELIQGYESIESQTRTILLKQGPIQQYLSNNMGIESRFTQLAQDVPLGTAISDLNFNGKDLDIKGAANSETTFAVMLAKFKKRDNVKRISLDETTYDQTTGMVKFGIKLSYK